MMLGLLVVVLGLQAENCCDEWIRYPCGRSCRGSGRKVRSIDGGMDR